LPSWASFAAVLSADVVTSASGAQHQSQTAKLNHGSRQSTQGVITQITHLLNAARFPWNKQHQRSRSWPRRRLNITGHIIVMLPACRNTQLCARSLKTRSFLFRPVRAALHPIRAAVSQTVWYPVRSLTYSPRNSACVRAANARGRVQIQAPNLKVFPPTPTPIVHQRPLALAALVRQLAIPSTTLEVLAHHIAVSAGHMKTCTSMFFKPMHHLVNSATH